MVGLLVAGIYCHLRLKYTLVIQCANLGERVPIDVPQLPQNSLVAGFSIPGRVYFSVSPRVY